MFSFGQTKNIFLSCFIPGSSTLITEIICLGHFTDLRLNDGILCQVFNSIIDFQ